MLYPQWFRKRLAVYRLLFVVGLAIALWVASPWVSAQETPKPKPEEWQINGILAALDDSDPGIKQRAFEKFAEFDANELTAFPNQSEEIAKRAIELVNDSQADSDIRTDAAKALGELGKVDESVVQSLTTLFNDNQADLSLRSIAAEALGELGKVDESVVQFLRTLFNDNQADLFLRVSAAKALGELGKADESVVQFLRTLVDDNQEEVILRINAAEALVKMGKEEQMVVDLLRTVVFEEEPQPYLQRDEVSNKLKPSNLGEFFVLVDIIYDVNSDELSYRRFDAYFYGGGINESKTLLQWIGRPDSNSIPTQLTHAQGKQILEVFANAWEPSANFPKVRNDLATAIGRVSRIVEWQSGDITLLEQHYKNLSVAKFNSADSVKVAIDSLAIWRWFNTVKTVIVIHLGFWVALIFLYPKFSNIQALFFWNPWVRNIAGLGYVSALLVTVPFLQRRLLAPFQENQRKEAGLDPFNPVAYFQESWVKRSFWSAGKETEETLPLTVAIPNLEGQMLLQADSGFGKTMFLRHLIHQSPQRSIVFLRATECAKTDVIQAIQAKLPLAAADPNFLKGLIYSGGIDIYIDGLNEVNAEAQASIKQFLSSYTKGNIILTTQPLSDKNPPKSAKIYHLLPLDDDQISRFLTSRHPKDAILQGEDYQQACSTYLEDVLNSNQSAEDLVAIRRVLSNPMDLDTIAEILAHTKRPELFHLQQQQYDRMAADYPNDNNDFSFPIRPVAQLAYEMRLSDQHLLPNDKISQNVIDSLEKHRLLTPKSGSWQFRHDKIQDFFIVQKYLEDEHKAYEELKEPKQMGDPRLRGVYLQLATELTLPMAQALEKDLFDYASSTGDHTTSDPFRKRLESRSKKSASTSFK